MASLGNRVAALVAGALLWCPGFVRAEAPRPLVVADLEDRTVLGVSFTYGQSECQNCVAGASAVTSTIYTLLADWSVRPGLKLWGSLPLAHRSQPPGPNVYDSEHTAFGQLSLGVRQTWGGGGAQGWRTRWSAGASFSGTPRRGAGGEAGGTLEAARLIAGVHSSHLFVTTTTTRLHGDARVERGPWLAQVGLALLARSPDEREVNGGLAFEVMVGARLHERVALLAEATNSLLDVPLICQSTCPDGSLGLPSLLSGNLGVRVTLPHALIGARIIVPLTDDDERYPDGEPAPREAVSRSLSVEASFVF